MKETTQDATTMGLRAWNVSDAEEMTGPSTACTKDRELGIQVSAAVLLRSRPMNESCGRQLSAKVVLQVILQWEHSPPQEDLEEKYFGRRAVSTCNLGRSKSEDGFQAPHPRPHTQGYRTDQSLSCFFRGFLRRR